MFVFSVILLFLLLPNKRNLRLKAFIFRLFLLFNFCHFSSKISFPELISREYTKEYYYFRWESIKACGFANMSYFNRGLNLFCFSKLRYRNNSIYLPLLLLLSADISLNPGPINGSQWYNKVFKKIGLHFMYINITVF